MRDVSQSSKKTTGLPIEQVLEELEQLVLEDLDPHASLPAEGELAQRLGVSRLTVREAIKILNGRGLVEVRQGRPPRVAEPNSQLISSYFSAMLRREPRGLFELLEVRQSLEVQSAILAARRCSRGTVAALDSMLQTMREATTEDEFNHADVQFHEILAMASGNRMLAFLVEALETPLRDSFVKSLQGSLWRGGAFEQTIARHAAIVACIRERDEEGAADAARMVLKQAELDLKAALRQPDAVDGASVGTRGTTQ